MKRNFLVILMLAAMLALSACTPARSLENQPNNEALVATLVSEMMAQQPPVTATAAPTQMLPQTGSAPTAVPEPTVVVEDNGNSATVNADSLNLRVGPGLNYRVRGILQAGQRVEVIGRSTSGDWIEVHLSDGRGGWVYRSYLDSTLDLAGLPVDEAFGGPVSAEATTQPAPQTPSRYSLSMTIDNNQALVSLNKFAASKDVIVSLSAGGKHMNVASGATDSSGAAAFSFEIPRYWPDGSPLKESSLTLTVSAVDGSASRNASITYYSGW